MIRIAYLISQYPATSHTFIRREVAALRARGWDIDTFSIRKPSEEERNSPIEQAEYRRTWYVLPPRPDIFVAFLWSLVANPVAFVRVLGLAFSHRLPGVRGLVWALFYFGEAMYLARELKKRGVDHVHNHFGNPAAIVGLLVTRYLGLTWSISLHGISEFDYPHGVLIGSKIANVDFASCCAHFTRSQAMRHSAPEHWPKLFITRTGLELDRLREAAGARQAGGSRLRILVVARLSAEKGLQGLLQAFANLVQQGVDAELRIVGSGPYEQQLRSTAQAFGVSDRCDFVGRLAEEKVASEYGQADIFAMSSLMEGLPVVLMEALALEVPVIAPNVAGIPELVVHNETGLLYRPGDWDDLGAQLSRLASDPELRRRLGARGRERVEEEFEIGRAVEPLHQRFTQLRDGGT